MTTRFLHPIAFRSSLAVDKVERVRKASCYLRIHEVVSHTFGQLKRAAEVQKCRVATLEASRISLSFQRLVWR